MLDSRKRATVVNMEDVEKIEYIKNRWRFITADGVFHDPCNAIEYAILFNHVPFLKANQTTLLNMKKVYFVAARKAHTSFGEVMVTRANQSKLRKFFKNST